MSVKKLFEDSFKKIKRPPNLDAQLKHKLKLDAMALADLQLAAIKDTEQAESKLMGQNMEVVIWLKNPKYLMNNPFHVYRKNGSYWVEPNMDPAGRFAVEHKTIGEVLKHITLMSR
jgi:hypothetical protein